MNEVLIAGLLASASHFQTAGESMIAGAEGLKALAAALEGIDSEVEQPDGSNPEQSPYKNSTGRMNLAGAKAVEAAFESGATITEVAKRFGIHTSASNYRHKQWMKSKKNKNS